MRLAIRKHFSPFFTRVKFASQARSDLHGQKRERAKERRPPGKNRIKLVVFEISQRNVSSALSDFQFALCSARNESALFTLIAFHAVPDGGMTNNEEKASLFNFGFPCIPTDGENSVFFFLLERSI